jgi:RNA polymerase sigma factor (TIGR02999 family)
MRRVLIDAARRRKSRKRGGGQQRVALEAVQSVDFPDDRLLALDEALERLELEKPNVAAWLKLRYFVGLKIDDAAEILEISPRTAKNWWAMPKPGYTMLWPESEQFQWKRPKSMPYPVPFFERTE